MLYLPLREYTIPLANTQVGQVCYLPLQEDVIPQLPNTHVGQVCYLPLQVAKTP